MDYPTKGADDSTTDANAPTAEYLYTLRPRADLMKLNELIRAFALQNALKYGGKANPGAVIGKVLSEHAELKDKIKELAKDVAAVIKDISKLKPDQQLAELQQLAPELLEEKKKEEKRELPDLENVHGAVKTAFPPEPSGSCHLGHIKGCLINYLYAKKYGGTFVLRWEDTNPELASKEFVDEITAGFKWIGLSWDEEIFISDTMPLLHKHCEKLLHSGHFYACTCEKEAISQSRMDGKDCTCRKRSITENLTLWNEMKAGKHDKGDLIIRYKNDMAHQNTVMRDPTMFRVVKANHWRQGTKYSAWPSYDFAAAFSDGAEGITHRIRSKEFELRAELQTTLQHLMGYKQTTITEQARFNLVGVESSKRKIREAINEGRLSGWDDPRLSTIAALRRRGFQPDAIKTFLFNLGITKHESTLTWDSIEAENRKVIDTIANRYFFIKDPIKVAIDGAPAYVATLHRHPAHPERGERHFSTHTGFWLQTSDIEQLTQKKLYRLMDCLNFTKTAKGYLYASRAHEDYKEKGEKIMHWLPASDDLFDVSVMMPDATTISGLGETTMNELKVNDVVQLERFGFCRVDRIDGKKIWFWYTHK